MLIMLSPKNSMIVVSGSNETVFCSLSPESLLRELGLLFDVKTVGFISGTSVTGEIDLLGHSGVGLCRKSGPCHHNSLVQRSFEWISRVPMSAGLIFPGMCLH